jgi:hypothetical protein
MKMGVLPGDRITGGGAAPPLPPLLRNVETTNQKQPGGNAAQLPHPNLNPEPQTNQKMQDTTNQQNLDSDRLIPLKEAASKSQCYHGTLKNNIKNGNLPASQAGPKAPYLVRLSDVEKLLRNSPGIASIFHPAKSAASVASQPEAHDADSTPDAANGDQQATAAADVEPALVPLPEAVIASHTIPDVAAPAAKVAPKVSAPAHNADAKDASAPESSQGGAVSPQSGDGGKRRRPRRRGKRRGAGISADNVETSPVFLKALTGTSPQERLRITACLNELASLVASA